MRKKTLMIIGASGFIGSNFIKKYKDNYNIIPVSLTRQKIEEIDFNGVDTVLHLAALVHQMKGAPREKYFEINTELTRKVAQKAKQSGVKHFIFYSTVKVYGYDGDLHNHDIILDEDSPCNPTEPYGESKLQAENILRSLENDDFKVAIIRPPMVYGEGVKGNMESLIKLVKFCPVLPFNYDKNRRSMVEINRLLNFTKAIIDTNFDGVFIPLDEKNISLKEIVERIEKELKVKRINISMIQPLFWLLCKIKPNIMLRLYGSLQFRSKKLKKF